MCRRLLTLLLSQIDISEANLNLDYSRFIQIPLTYDTKTVVFLIGLLAVAARAVFKVRGMTAKPL